MMNDNLASSFYDAISEYYDEMIRFEERLVSERHVLKAWSDKFRFKSVLDAGCGSGLHTIVLNQLGIDAIGIDISAKMIDKARQNAQRLGQLIKFYELGFDQLERLRPTQFDTVFILGNSLPHIHTPSELSQTIEVIRSLLSKRGVLIIQMLNYDKILKNRNRIVSVNRYRDREFIRFYDFTEPLIRFNILSIYWSQGNSTHSLSTTELYPYKHKELIEIIESRRFTIGDRFGSMKFDPFKEDESKDCIIVAES